MNRFADQGQSAPAGVAGVWLVVSPPREPVDALLVSMLAASQPSVSLREAIVEELGRPAKLTDVVLECLGLRAVGVERAGSYPLHLVAPKPGRDPWREALTVPGGDCPIGFVVSTADQGRIVLVHEVVGRFGAAQQDLVRRQAALVAAGASHGHAVERLARELDDFAATVAAARRQVQVLDPSVLVSPDGRIRVQLGSLSQTTRNLLREGLHGEQLFLLPTSLFQERTNHGDVEFLVYLNFFARHGLRTHIAGTARQRGILARLLTLTIFGPFEPGVDPPASFEEVQRSLGTLDRETYELFLLAFQTFGVRREPDGPMLTLSDYVDYAVLGPDETRIPMGPGSASEVWVKPNGHAFDVRVGGSSGPGTAKSLELTSPRRVGGNVPDDCLRALRFSIDRPRFGVTSLGTSHGFDPAGDLTSFVVWVNGKGILVDPSPEALAYLDRIGVAASDVPYVFLTHVHADHDGGLIEKLLSGRRTTVIASDAVFHAFAEKTRLITGHSFEGEGLVKHVSANPGYPVRIELAGEAVTIETRWNLHPIPTNGLRLSCGGRSFGYSGDTKYDPSLLRQLRDQGRLTAGQYDALMHFFWTPDGTPSVDLLYHEAGVPPIHTRLEHLAALSPDVRARTRVVHVADRDVPAGSSPAKPLPFETHVLLPATPESRERALLETIRLVGYLYDAPPALLRELLDGAVSVTYGPGDVIVKKGAVEPGEALCFYVVADGRVAVKDGRRVIAHLVKADSFGEWGISHQRGFRVADVVATQATQCLRFGEALYQRLVAGHPVVQERISRIRSLLPRLQLAQERARLKREPDAGARRSVLETMTANQLASFALFSEIKPLQNGQEVITEGDRADGFYALLSGHLVASRGGRPVGELSEGDVFGEMGLLDGGRRRATITVVSADAEALFMSTGSFRELLRSVPAFAWDIWETATDRRNVARHAAGDG